MDKMERRARALEISAILLSRTFTAISINTPNFPQQKEKGESSVEDKAKFIEMPPLIYG